jgi:hypothetical protein
MNLSYFHYVTYLYIILVALYVAKNRSTGQHIQNNLLFLEMLGVGYIRQNAKL